MKTARIMTLAVTTLICSARVAGAQVDDHLKCYKIRDRSMYSALVNLTSSQFGVENGCRVKVKGAMYCVPVSKEVVSPNVPRLSFDTQALTDDRICYKMKCPDVSLPPMEVSDQFGTRNVERSVATMLCTPAVQGVPSPPTATCCSLAAGGSFCYALVNGHCESAHDVPAPDGYVCGQGGCQAPPGTVSDCCQNADGCLNVGEGTICQLVGGTVTHNAICDTDGHCRVTLPIGTPCTNNVECGGTNYCQTPDGHDLGGDNCGGQGSCQLTPEYCLAVYDPVCGCDGLTYGNSCNAAQANVSVASNGQCGSCRSTGQSCLGGNECCSLTCMSGLCQ